METQKTLNSQSNLEKEKWSWKNQVPDFKQYYKATVIKTVWYWHKTQKYRPMEQDRKPPKKIHEYSQLILYRGAKNTHWRKDSQIGRAHV